MRRGAARRLANLQVVFLRKQLDTRGAAVNVDDVAEVETVALLTNRRLAKLALNALEIDRQTADVDLRRRVRRRRRLAFACGRLRRGQRNQAQEEGRRRAAEPELHD